MYTSENMFQKYVEQMNEVLQKKCDNSYETLAIFVVVSTTCMIFHSKAYKDNLQI